MTAPWAPTALFASGCNLLRAALRLRLIVVQQIVNDLHDVDLISTDARYADGDTATGLVESLAKVHAGFHPEHFAAVLTKVRFRLPP